MMLQFTSDSSFLDGALTSRFGHSALTKQIEVECDTAATNCYGLTVFGVRPQGEHYYCCQLVVLLTF